MIIVRMIGAACRGVGRMIERLFWPDAGRRQSNILNSIRSLRSLFDAQTALAREDLRHQRVVEKRLFGELARAETRLRKVMDERFVEAARERHQFDEKLHEVATSLDLFQRHKAIERTVARHLAGMRQNSRPIVVGPWTGEVGFEILYWIPFVRWAAETYQIDPARFIAVSRGGPSSWYRGLSSRFVDVFSLVRPAELQTGAAQYRKQAIITPLDRSILRMLRQRVGERFELLHPSLMYQVFAPTWRRGESPELVMRLTQHRAIAPPLPSEMALPEHYVAMKWYFSTSFPDTPENRQFVADIIRTTAERTTVVLLDTGLGLDDHQEYGGGSSPRVRTIRSDVTNTNNLDVQTAIIAGADAFLGTYGGFSYLAPLVGTDSVACYSNRAGFNPIHLDTARRVFAQVNGGAFVPLHTSEVDVLSRMLPARATVAPDVVQR